MRKIAKLENFDGMNQKTIDKILGNLVEQLVPKGSNIAQLSKATKLSESALRNLRNRKSISADTLLKLLLAHGVSSDLLTNLPRNKPSKISKTLTDWNKIGLSLSDREREKLGGFVKTLKSDWRLK